MRALIVFGLTLALIGPSSAGEIFRVHAADVADRKAVIATVEPVHEFVARARIGGTIAALSIKEGEKVNAGEVVAQVTDAKLALQMQALDARIASQKSQRDQAKIDYDRASELMRRGAGMQSQLDQTKTNLDVADRNLAALKGDREVIAQQSSEGAVLAPGAARVLTIPVSVGRVVLPGETIATLAEDQYILRLQLPERYAQFLRAGAEASIAARGLSGQDDEAAMRKGRVRIVYPEIQGGRVIADVDVSGLGDYFVGERTLAYIDVGARKAIVIPASFVYRRAAVNYVRLENGDEVVVQPGQPRTLDGALAVEILSGLKDGDRIVAP
jgi:RND family efflux transporter MFP subunit